ncbi:MAG: hypothetical protein PHC51_00995 [bacterium]|nr:hypothetical protein [bacterium]
MPMISIGIFGERLKREVLLGRGEGVAGAGNCHENSVITVYLLAGCCGSL